MAQQLSICRAGAACRPTAARGIFSANAGRPAARAVLRSQRQQLRMRAEAEPQAPGTEVDNPDSEAARKKAEADRLRAAEKFMVVGTGEAECKGCGFTYTPKKGDPEYPVAPGTAFNNLPEDWQCPTCGAEKNMFVSKQKEVAGFAENQGYGLGTNAMTGEQKSLLIFGGLGFMFLLLLLGYTMQ